jgi:hypothetical protein
MFHTILFEDVIIKGVFIITTLVGVEPTVSRLEVLRIIQLCYRARFQRLVGVRSRYLSLTKRVLYQLSYESIVLQPRIELGLAAPLP